MRGVGVFGLTSAAKRAGKAEYLDMGAVVFQASGPLTLSCSLTLYWSESWPTADCASEIS